MKIKGIEEALTGGYEGELSRKDEFYLNIFGHDFYIEVDCSWDTEQVDGGDDNEKWIEVASFQVDTVNAYSGEDCEVEERWIEKLITNYYNN